MLFASHQHLKQGTQLSVKHSLSFDSACSFVDTSSIKCKWQQLNMKHVKQSM